MAQHEEGFGGDLWVVSVPDAVTYEYTVVCLYRIDVGRATVQCYRIELRVDPPQVGH